MELSPKNGIPHPFFHRIFHHKTIHFVASIHLSRRAEPCTSGPGAAEPPAAGGVCQRTGSAGALSGALPVVDKNPGFNGI